MELGLNGKTAIVTGGSKGIGKATAMTLAAEGCGLHLAARTEADLEAAAHEIHERYQVPVTIHPLDLSVGENAVALAETCRDAEILVNNAGAIPSGPLDEIDEAIWRQAWDLKVFGYVNLCREMYRHMKTRGGGVIVNVIGTAGERPNFGYITGSAGNASLMAFTRALGSRSADDNIRVVGVNPGLTETERLTRMSRQRQAGGGPGSEAWSKFMASLPFGRPGTAAEVGDLVAFLASDRASYISGTVVTIDGGHSAQA